MTQERQKENELDPREKRILHETLAYLVRTSQWPSIRYLSLAIAEPKEIKKNSKGEEIGISTSQIKKYINNLKDQGFWEAGDRVKSIGIITLDEPMKQ